ncbi:MAG: hypothetical protein QM784_18925 [Polyangiaceae bacterium]
MKLDVFRRIEDGVPLRVKTLLVLQVSGKTRELRLAGALLDGTRPLEIEAAIPAKLEDNGELALQVHPGEHRITFTSLYPVPPEQLGIPAHRSPWPELETWVYVPDSAQRQVVVSGAPGIRSSSNDASRRLASSPGLLAQRRSAPAIRDQATRRAGTRSESARTQARPMAGFPMAPDTRCVTS